MAAQFSELAVFRPEIMAPFTDAVGLIHGDEAGLPPFQILDESAEHQAFGRHVEQPVLSLVQPAQPFPRFIGGKRGI